MNERWEDICARLCLLTDAAASPDEPDKPMTRAAVRRMIDEGVLRALVLRKTQSVSEQTLDKAEGLLSRVRRVYDLLEEYEAQGYRGLTPQDELWPEELACMGKRMPLFLFVKGNVALLRSRKIAVAGSRDIAPETRRMARRIGQRMAKEGIILVCGGARGVDAAVQNAAVSAGGSLILVPAKPAHELLRIGLYRDALEQGRLLLVCDTLPDAPFTAEKALMRNNIIYSLGSAAFVLASRAERGGSWHGAMDCLRGGWSPVFVTDDGGADMAGNRLLLARGAKRYEESVPLAEMIRVARAQRVAKQGTFL